MPSIRWLLPALIAAACTTASPPVSVPLSSVPLTEVQWRLIQLEGRPALAPSAERTAGLRFTADGTRVTGFTTCNHLFGSYDAPGGDRLRLADLATTKMACVEPALARQEQRFVGVLQRVGRFAITADTLTILDGARPLARFVAEPTR